MKTVVRRTAVLVMVAFMEIVLGSERSLWNREAYKKENPLDPTLQDMSFFQRIQSLNLGPDEILSSYKNITAQVKTTQCFGICKSTAALWLLQELSPCENIERADCPTGLLCCVVSLKKQAQRPDYPLKTGEEEKKGDLSLAEDHTRVSYVPFSSSNGSEELYYPEPILDPIPNDEASETLKL